MPSLYALNLAILFVQYWIDKWLLFNYYKRTPQFTHHLSKSVVNLLPFAIVIHLMFAFMTFSYPYFFRSGRAKPWFGNNSQYFNKERMGQIHVIILLAYSLLNILIFLMEDFCVDNWSACCHSCNIKCKVCCARCNGKEFDELDFEGAGFVLSDDILLEVKFTKLYKMYVQALKDLQRYKQQMAKGIYKEDDHKYYVRKYMELLERNINEMRQIIGEKYEIHEDMVHSSNQDMDFEVMSME